MHGKMPQSKCDIAKKSGFSAIYRQTQPKFIEIAIARAYTIIQAVNLQPALMIKWFGKLLDRGLYIRP